MKNVNKTNNQNNIPLVVDLDGTLIKTDLLLESIFPFIKSNPVFIFELFKRPLNGINFLKKYIAEQIIIDVRQLPYNNTLLDYLKNEYNKGRKLVLATASYTTYAYQIADYLGIFSEVFATDKYVNLKGNKKLRLLLDQFGENGFDYAGNSKSDLKIFPHSKNAILVGPSRTILKRANRNSNVTYVFKNENISIVKYLKAIRVEQWLKNILLFVALVTSHNWFNLSMVIRDIVGFVALSFCASGTYILNDLFDLSSDRKHPIKKSRPLAAGDISILNSIMLSCILIITGLITSYILDLNFLVLMLIYLFITVSYSLYLKSYMLIDVLILASLYTIRVIGGAELIKVELSFWLLAFSVFIFFSLALLKRCTELQLLNNMDKTRTDGRDYYFNDIQSLRSMGISSGFLSIVVFSLYINSPDVLSHYSQPKLLWLICPALLYWINHLWLRTGRDAMCDDPFLFAIRDRGSRIFIISIILLLFLAGNI